MKQKEAEQLWEQLALSLLDAEAALKRIIESKAWEPLGYDTLADAWNANMSGITLAAELRPHVVYAMFDSGATADEVSGAVKGVGPRQAKNMKRQRDIGIPADLVNVREHERSKPSEARYLTLDVGPERLAEWKELAKQRGWPSVQDMAVAILKSNLEVFEAATA